ncbi:hypothetical protein CQA40_07600 [Helicobacter sp. MIT 01-3238]|nr:hypothetical protein CQA40_07600 [Helicobacter sp. MIT 01-3238]
MFGFLKAPSLCGGGLGVGIFCLNKNAEKFVIARICVSICVAIHAQSSLRENLQGFSWQFILFLYFFFFSLDYHASLATCLQ